MKAEFKEDCKYKDEIKEDTIEVFNKWLKRYGWDIPEVDEDIAAKLILTEMKEAIKELEDRFCQGSCDIESPKCES
ncbi:MAG TPA: hypothetical protein EYP79_01830 [Campylobacterales bacterium]|nr:hypothetical protein [Campylobacterales bacterium]